MAKLGRFTNKLLYSGTVLSDTSIILDILLVNCCMGVNRDNCEMTGLLSSFFTWVTVFWSLGDCISTLRRWGNTSGTLTVLRIAIDLKNRLFPALSIID